MLKHSVNISIDDLNNPSEQYEVYKSEKILSESSLTLDNPTTIYSKTSNLHLASDVDTSQTQLNDLIAKNMQPSAKFTSADSTVQGYLSDSSLSSLEGLEKSVARKYSTRQSKRINNSAKKQLNGKKGNNKHYSVGVINRTGFEGLASCAEPSLELNSENKNYLENKKTSQVKEDILKDSMKEQKTHTSFLKRTNRDMKYEDMGTPAPEQNNSVSANCRICGMVDNNSLKSNDENKKIPLFLCNRCSKSEISEENFAFNSLENIGSSTKKIPIIEEEQFFLKNKKFKTTDNKMLYPIKIPKFKEHHRPSKGKVIIKLKVPHSRNPKHSAQFLTKNRKGLGISDSIGSSKKFVDRDGTMLCDIEIVNDDDANRELKDAGLTITSPLPPNQYRILENFEEFVLNNVAYKVPTLKIKLDIAKKPDEEEITKKKIIHEKFNCFPLGLGIEFNNMKFRNLFYKNGVFKDLACTDEEVDEREWQSLERMCCRALIERLVECFLSTKPTEYEPLSNKLSSKLESWMDCKTKGNKDLNKGCLLQQVRFMEDANLYSNIQSSQLSASVPSEANKKDLKIKIFSESSNSTTKRNPLKQLFFLVANSFRIFKSSPKSTKNFSSNRNEVAMVLVTIGFLGIFLGTLVIFGSESEWDQLLDMKNTKWLSDITKRSTIIPLPQERISNINCRSKHKICQVSNLYFLDGNLHAYLGRNATINPYMLQNQTIITGIGFGSPSIKPVLAETYNKETWSENYDYHGNSEKSSSMKNTEIENGSLQSQSKISLADSIKRNMIILPLIIHFDDPPSLSTESVKYISEPTAFFSVMWDNLFRSIYAGIGAFNSLLYFDTLNFYGRNRMVVIENNKPSRFVKDILQFASPFPVKWHKELEDCLFRSATLGISRDFGIAEIKVETQINLTERILRRNTAYKFFCKSLKSRILDQRDTKNKKILKLIRGSNNMIENLNDFSSFDVSDLITQDGSENDTDEDDINEFDEDEIISMIPVSESTLPLPVMTLILRDGNTRRIINEKKLVLILKKLPVKLGVYRFGTMSFSDQMAIMDQTNILMTMHGAALTHLLFLRKNSFVIELFPYGFRKTVFNNMARIMGHKYLFWQNTHLNNTVFDYKYVEEHKFSNLSKEEIVSKPINWRNMDSKNYWRNQDTKIEFGEFLNIWENSIVKNSVDFSLHDTIMFQPSGFFTEQLASFRVACALGKYLNRRVVLPLLGFQIAAPTNDDSHRLFHVAKVNWRPMEHYFDQKELLGLKCKWISHENFQNLNQNRSIQKIRTLKDQVFFDTQEQIAKYYNEVLGLPFVSILKEHSIHPQFNAQELKRKYGHRKSSTLAFGELPISLFDFNAKDPEELEEESRLQSLRKTSAGVDNKQSELLRRFPNAKKALTLLGDQSNAKKNEKTEGLVFERLQENIFNHLNFREELWTVAKDAISKINGKYVAIHARRGYIGKKCQIMIPKVQSRWQSLTQEQLQHDIRECHQNTRKIEKNFKRKVRNPAVKYVNVTAESLKDVRNLQLDGYKITEFSQDNEEIKPYLENEVDDNEEEDDSIDTTIFEAIIQEAIVEDDESDAAADSNHSEYTRMHEELKNTNNNLNEDMTASNNDKIELIVENNEISVPNLFEKFEKQLEGTKGEVEEKTLEEELELIINESKQDKNNAKIEDEDSIDDDSEIIVQRPKLEFVVVNEKADEIEDEVDFKVENNENVDGEIQIPAQMAGINFKVTNDIRIDLYSEDLRNLKSNELGMNSVVNGEQREKIKNPIEYITQKDLLEVQHNYVPDDLKNEEDGEMEKNNILTQELDQEIDWDQKVGKVFLRKRDPSITSKIYIATDDLGSVASKKEFQNLGRSSGWESPIFFNDIISKKVIASAQESKEKFVEFLDDNSFDPIDLSIIEIIICLEAEVFFGNRFSTFSQEIFARRQAKGKKSYYL
ncbi:hypothetical protein HDU92_003877 [Lobulomyces angularis]|nr:hypothetical protein HDU92_003877 [Lobulomyces angularis]